MDGFDPADRRELLFMILALIFFGAIGSFGLAAYILITGGEIFAAALALLGGLVITVGLVVGFGPGRRLLR